MWLSMMLISSSFLALSNIAYMSAPHQHRVRLADNKIIFIMLVSSEVWAGGYFATISPDWSLLQNGRWTGCWASLCCVIPISREENNQQCDRYSSASGALALCGTARTFCQRQLISCTQKSANILTFHVKNEQFCNVNWSPFHVAYSMFMQRRWCRYLGLKVGC